MTMQQQVAIGGVIRRFTGSPFGYGDGFKATTPAFGHSAPTMPSVEAIPIPPSAPTPISGGSIPISVPTATPTAVTPIQLAAQPSAPSSSNKTLYIVGGIVLLIVLFVAFRR